MTFVATCGTEKSKTILLDDMISVAWLPKDSIKIFQNGENGLFVSENTDTVKSAIFKGQLTTAFGSNPGEPYESSRFWAVYPYSEETTFDSDHVELTLPSIQMASDSTFSRNTLPMLAVSENTNLYFNHICGGICFKVAKDSVKTVVFSAPEGGKLAGKVKVGLDDNNLPEIKEYVETAGELTVTAPSNGYFKIDVPYFAVMLPGEIPAGLQVRFLRDSVCVDSTVVETAGIIRRARFVKLGETDPEPEFVDLAKNGTANCYVVAKEGSYTFPVVKGNTNETAGNAESAVVIWETLGNQTKPKKGDIISEVKLEDGIVKFTTHDPITNGNAVIAVKDASGVILWSWHIWVCQGFNPEDCGQIYNNNAGIVLDRNLGALSSVPGNDRVCGLLYQWGRKDPFPGGSSIESNIAAYTTIDTWPTPVENSQTTGTMAYATKNPSIFIKGNIKGDWMYTQDNTLWSSTKTINDPCPPGWRVPGGGANGIWAKALGSFSSFTDSTLGNNAMKSINLSSKLGNGIDEIYYHASAMRGYTSGYLGTVGSSKYWSCTVTGYTGYVFNISSTGTYNPSATSQKGAACPIRCMKIEQED